MTVRPTEIQFAIGERCLFKARRNLSTVAWSLDQLLGHERLPKLTEQHPKGDGLRLLSCPRNRLDALERNYPGYVVGQAEHYARHYIDMRTGYHSYLAQFSTKTRSTLARKSRKLAKLSGGEIDIRSYHRIDQLDEFLDHALALSKKTYQAQLLQAGLPDCPRFHAEAQALARADNLRAFLLFIDDKAVSYLFLPVKNDVLVYAYLGYDPDFRKLSVGTVLHMAALEQLFAEDRFRYFDFTEGSGAHKAMFGTHSIAAANVILLKRSPLNRLLLSAHAVFTAITEQLSDVADAMGAKAHLRQILRKQL